MSRQVSRKADNNPADATVPAIQNTERPVMSHTLHANAPPSPDVPSPVLGARFSLDQAVGLAITDRSHTAVDGGWWPHSRDAATEIAGLVTALSGQLGRVVRVAVDRADFDDIPRKITLGGRVVRIGWFDNLGRQVILTRGRQDQFLLHLIPPHTPPADAHAALAAAATGSSNTPQLPQATHPDATSGDPYQPQPDRWADDGAPLFLPHWRQGTGLTMPPGGPFTALCEAAAFLVGPPRQSSAP